MHTDVFGKETFQAPLRLAWDCNALCRALMSLAVEETVQIEGSIIECALALACLCATVVIESVHRASMLLFRH